MSNIVKQQKEELVSKETLIKHLDTLGLANSLTPQEKESYFEIAMLYGLNPFKREIYVSKYGNQMSVITGYEVYIKRAERTGMLDGWEATTSGSVKNGDLKATVKIFRKDRTHPFVWEALYEECVQRTREGKVTKFWEKAAFMTKKVAISQGFRLCFSDELAGMPYTADEMPDKEVYEDVAHVEVQDVAKVSKVDYMALLDSANSLEELKQFYLSIPKEDRKQFDSVVVQLKATFDQAKALDNE